MYQNEVAAMLTQVLALPEMRCDMNIQRFRDSRINSRTKPVRMETIGNDRVQFVSDLKLPAEGRLVLGLRVSFRQLEAYVEGIVTAVEEAPNGAGYRYAAAMTNRSAADDRWRHMINGVYTAQQEQYEKIERLYRLWQQPDAGSGQVNVRL